ncbi:MAG: hypothetical protein AAF471_04395, partial [Myxococcota bacterium]
MISLKNVHASNILILKCSSSVANTHLSVDDVMIWQLLSYSIAFKSLYWLINHRDVSAAVTPTAGNRGRLTGVHLGCISGWLLAFLHGNFELQDKQYIAQRQKAT